MVCVDGVCACGVCVVCVCGVCVCMCATAPHLKVGIRNIPVKIACPYCSNDFLLAPRGNHGLVTRQLAHHNAQTVRHI